MLNRYSIAKARDKFGQIVHAVEQGKSVEITRRGKPVAVVLSLTEYQRLTDRQIGFDEGLEAFRQKYQPDDTGTRGHGDAERDVSQAPCPGR
ncbi:MAG: type II toxin-antitoxin system Phd/YefM family antitoxin [Calothrix sp. MO_167.B12]|nr:type II toxin-antitoxin system Phd/YefM family antitoxin [Calothrix sp. MO_167.B12]